jgi:hypothetical protein
MPSWNEVRRSSERFVTASGIGKRVFDDNLNEALPAGLGRLVTQLKQIPMISVEILEHNDRAKLSWRGSSRKSTPFSRMALSAAQKSSV